MCGIFGFWLRRELRSDDLTIGRNGVQALAHRGPDARGEWVDMKRGIFLGHTRLAIQDLSSSSNQPMTRYGKTVVFNGEIYNFRELREELEKRGCVFSTSGDCEVLLAAWETWGQDALNRFDGMFGVAMYEHDHLNLMTDAFGEKPLYVLNKPEGLFFSSEPRALISSMGLKFNPTEEEISQFLTLGFIPHPNTGFVGLEALGPGVVRCYHRSGEFHEREHWSLAESPSRKRVIKSSDLDDLADILIDSIKKRLRSDVPFGLFLSSGVDSALIAALASQELRTPVESLTVSFKSGVDEGHAASDIAQHFGLRHRVLDVGGDFSRKSIPEELIALYGTPNDNVSGLFVKRLAEIAKADMTVALGGLGGDELFYGYNKYSFLHRYSFAYRVPYPWIKYFSGIKVLFPEGRVSRAFDMLSGDPAERYIRVKNNGLGKLLDLGYFTTPNIPRISNTDDDLLLLARNFDLRQTLPCSYAAAVDRGGMAAGVEIRTPYLCKQLFRFVDQFEARVFFNGGQKALLKALLRRYLPDYLVDAPKRGFIYPIQDYLRRAPDKVPGGLNFYDAELVNYVWSRRSEKSFREIALRLMIISTMYSEA